MEKIDKVVKKWSKDTFEVEGWRNGLYTCGIDEVGRGSLAGPLVTAAVILPVNKKIIDLHDSKTLKKGELNECALWIRQNCWYTFGIVDHRVVDKHNIWHATLIAMKKAVIHLFTTSPRPYTVLVDAMPLSLHNTGYFDIPVHYFPRGEEKSSSIAAASIIAKVKRDEMMCKYNKLFPGFALDEHKGYGTHQHTSILKTHMPLIIHRRSFLSSTQCNHKQEEYGKQQSIC